MEWQSDGNLVRNKRQNIQLELAFTLEVRGEASSDRMEGTESRTAKAAAESQAARGPSMEAIVETDNLKKALAQVRLNKEPRALTRHRVNHDILMGLVARRVSDRHNIYVRSRRAGERVMASIEKFLDSHLKLRINRAKSAVAPPMQRKFLVFSFTNRKRAQAAALARFKAKVRDLTRRTRGESLAQIVEELSGYLIGWRGYFGFCETPSVLRMLDEWVRRWLRAVAWKQWKRGKRRFGELRQRGVGLNLAAQTAGSPHGPWCLSTAPRSPPLSQIPSSERLASPPS